MKASQQDNSKPQGKPHYSAVPVEQLLQKVGEAFRRATPAEKAKAQVVARQSLSRLLNG